MVAKSKDADWNPLTPAKISSNRRIKSTGKADSLLPKKGMASTNGSANMRRSTRTKGGTPSKAKADGEPKILKKRRQARKRMSSNKLDELTKVVRDIGRCVSTASNFSWPIVRRERSNTPVRRRDFKSGFAAYNFGAQVESVNKGSENLDAECVVGSEINQTTCLQLEEDIIGKDKEFATDASTEKMDCDGTKRLDQNDCAATFSCSHHLSSSSSTAPMSEGNGCDGINNSVILDKVTNVTAAESEENTVAWVPQTPQIGAQVRHSEKDDGFESNDTVLDSANQGQSESLIDILKKKTPGVNLETNPHKRMKMKRHRPKVVDPIKPVTPKPKTPKPARKVKKDDEPATRKSRKRACRRKLDFDEEHEEETKRQEEEETKPPKICKKRRRMRQRVSHAKLNKLIRLIRERLASESDPKQQEVEEESVVRKPAVDNNESIQRCCESCQDEAKKQENVLLIQDKAVRVALEDFVVKKMQGLSIEDDGSDQLAVQDPNRSGAIVVSGKQTDPSKNHKATVDLDQKTMVVWDLFMKGDFDEAAEAEALGDDDYMKLKEERDLFRQRLQMFLKCANLVQGNREFSPWKGSIVDSIIGVFLTQNVSDHLSSSAFMSLVARYPPLSLDEQNSQIQQMVLLEPPSDMTEESNSISQVGPPMTENGNVDPTTPVEPPTTPGRKGGKKKQKTPVNWEDLRKKYSRGMSRERTEQNADSVNWEAVRQASATDLAKVIVDRGMNNQLAGRIKGFLDRIVKDHGSIDLEWLRCFPPPIAKDYLLSISGLGLKSTECVRLLALHFPAFPVDTNAGRFFVRVGWVPLKLPEGVALHELNQYPSLDGIQKYLWPRFGDNKHPLLYETHCHSVTFAKAFCTKTRPNCNQCPMRGECKHYASALASAQPRIEEALSQEAPMLTNSDGDESTQHSDSEPIIKLLAETQHSSSEPSIEILASPVAETETQHSSSEPIIEILASPVAETETQHSSSEPSIEILASPVAETETQHSSSEPIIEIPASPVAEMETETVPLICDIEDMGRDSAITFISKALVAINPNIESILVPQIKLQYRLRTVHEVYELPDSHPLLATFPKRIQGERSPYLLAIWKEDECIEEPTTCDIGSSPCLSIQVAQYEKLQRIKGTILIPVYTAVGGQFPLNGTYFQINEVFADHESSLQPIDVPRELIWNLKTRVLYCGTSITSICRELSMLEVACVFRLSFMCIRGYDRKSKAAKSLARKFHLCKSRPPGK